MSIDYAAQDRVFALAVANHSSRERMMDAVMVADDHMRTCDSCQHLADCEVRHRLVDEVRHLSDVHAHDLEAWREAKYGAES